MKLIISRKGFDSSAGGVPNPIFPDDGLLSLPIPDEHSPIRYGDIAHAGGTLGELVEALTNRTLLAHHGAHLDPDLRAEDLPRLPGWRPMLGQHGAAQSHLQNQGVGPGDVFLFFTVFRRVMLNKGQYQWLPQSSPVHLLWGWLQVGEVLDLNSDTQVPAWAAYHPHCYREAANNMLYMATDKLTLHGQQTQWPGAGVFPYWRSSLQLTAPHSTKPSLWQLPHWFYPEAGKRPLTYHGNLQRWQREQGYTLLQSVYRGQEFVLDLTEYPEGQQWVRKLISENA